MTDAQFRPTWTIGMEQTAIINPGSFRIWLLQRIDQLEHFRRHPEQDGEIWEWYPWIVEEASDRAARLGWFELFEQACRFPGRIGAMEAKGYLARCLAACNEASVTEPCEVVHAVGETPTKDSATDGKGEGPLPKELSSRCQNALRQYYVAVKQLGRVTDDEAYEWLCEHCEAVDDPLPAKETWKRYVREARSHFNVQKNTPRAGREHGGSIVTPDQIEPRREVG